MELLAACLTSTIKNRKRSTNYSCGIIQIVNQQVEYNSMSRFKPIKRDMNYLFPPSMSDWLPEHHLARFIVEIVEQLD